MTSAVNLSQRKHEQNHNEDVLERMLKEAEELALKMSRRSESSIITSSSNISHASNSTETATSTGGIAVGKLSGAVSASDLCSIDSQLQNDDRSIEDHDINLEELLKKSEALLGKMRSGSAGSAAAAANSCGTNGGDQSAISPPIQAENYCGSNMAPVEPPGTSPNAPTSVYVLDPSSNSDDVSSVGSSSLRSPLISPKQLRVPSYSSHGSSSFRSQTDPIAEEPLLPAVPDTKVDLKGSNSGIPPPPIPQPINNETSNFPAPITTKIPDFMVTPKDAKWEKVSTACEGDDDYVPLVDYSKHNKGSPTTAVSTDLSTTSSDMGVNGEESDLYVFQSKDGSVVTNSGRVAAYRANKRRQRQKRKRRVQIALITLAIVVCGTYYVFLSRPSTTKTNSLFGKNIFNENLFDSFDGLADKKGCFGEYNVAQDESVCAEYPDGNKYGKSDMILEEYEKIGKEQDTSLQFEKETSVELLDDDFGEKNKRGAVKSERVGDHNNDGIDEDMIDNLRNKNLVMERKCKNIFHRLTNRNCRILAREARETKSQKRFPRINLQAIAGL